MSVFCAAGVFPAFWPQGIVDYWAPVLAEVVVLDDYRFVSYFGYLSS